MYLAWTNLSFGDSLTQTRAQTGGGNLAFSLCSSSFNLAADCDAQTFASEPGARFSASPPASCSPASPTASPASASQAGAQSKQTEALAAGELVGQILNLGSPGLPGRRAEMGGPKRCK